MKRYIPVFILALVGLFGCAGSSSGDDCTSEECLKRKAYDNVIAVHDEVMPKLSQISKLKEQIEDKLKTVEDTAVMADWEQLMMELDDADNSMWVWMRQFDSDLDDLSYEEVMTYLKEEQEKVDEVARKINESILKAEERLGE